MANIWFKNLTCSKLSDDWGTGDEVFLRFKVDGGKTKYWPPKGSWADMYRGSEFCVDEIIQFRETLKVELWEDDDDDAEDLLIGRNTFKASAEAPTGVITLEGNAEGAIYTLQYEYLPENMKILQLENLKCAAVAHSISPEEMKKYTKLGAELMKFFAKCMEGADDPGTKKIAKFLDEGVDVAEKQAGVVIDEESKKVRPDYIYMSRVNDQDIKKRFWPKVAEYKEIRNGQMERFRNVRFPLTTENINISLWADDSRTVLLGTFTVEVDKADGVYAVPLESKDMGSSYFMAYRIFTEGEEKAPGGPDAQ